MYYRMQSNLMDINVLLDQESHLELDLISGEKIADEIPGPIEFSMEVDEDEDGNPEEPILYAYFQNSSVMHNALIEKLRECAVDNIQVFPAVIENSATGERITDYSVVNVVGLVSCADMAESDAEPLADVHYFKSLVIDPKRTMGLRMFRLAESQMEIVIDETLAQAIMSGEFTGLILEPAKEKEG